MTTVTDDQSHFYYLSLSGCKVCIALIFGMDIHGAQRMNPEDFGDRLTFLLLPSSTSSAKPRRVADVELDYSILF